MYDKNMKINISRRVSIKHESYSVVALRAPFGDEFSEFRDHLFRKMCRENYKRVKNCFFSHR